MIDGFALGPLYIRFYGIILMLGAVAGGFLATVEVKRRNQDPEMVWDLLVYLIIGGVIGARIWHIFTPPPSSIAEGITTQYYLTHPLDALAIWKGGLGIPGAIIGGLIAMLIYARAHKEISFVEWTDIAAPSLALGQAIGRWGNFFNQELYGAPTNLPWKIYIDPNHRLPGFAGISYYHPLFAYESLLDVANMLFLLWILRQYAGRLKKGDVFNVYLIIYPVIRFGLDFLRLDASRILNVDINQTISGIVAVLAIAFLVWRHRQDLTTQDLHPMVEPGPVRVTEMGDTTLPVKEGRAAIARKSSPRKRAGTSAAKKKARRE